MKLRNVTYIFFSFSAYVLALPALSAGLQPSGNLQNQFYKTNELEPLTSPARLVNGLSSFFSQLFLAVSIWFFFLAGYQYMTAGGDEEKFGKAKRNMIYAMVGLVVGLGAYAMPALIAALLERAPTGF